MSARNDLVGEVLRGSVFFKFYKTVAEYNLNSINSDWKSKKEKVDWIIKELRVAIEVDGEHHFKAIRYGGITEGEAEDRYFAQLKRDGYKDYYCELAGWKLIRIPYFKKLNTFADIEIFLLEKINGSSI